jgi:hypothetical protein
VALFETAAAISAAAATVPAVASVAKAWLASKRKHSDNKITVTLSDGGKVTVTTSKEESDKLIAVLTKVQADELAAEGENSSAGEEQ